MYEEMIKILSINSNYLEICLKKNQIIIIDNYSVLNGRNSFPLGTYREYNRVNFMGDGELRSELKFGVLL